MQTKTNKLNKALKIIGIYCRSWTCDIKDKEYFRFFKDPNNTFFGPGEDIYTAHSYKEACIFAKEYIAACYTGQKRFDVEIIKEELDEEIADQLAKFKRVNNIYSANV